MSISSLIEECINLVPPYSPTFLNVAAFGHFNSTACFLVTPAVISVHVHSVYIFGVINIGLLVCCRGHLPLECVALLDLSPIWQL